MGKETAAQKAGRAEIIIGILKKAYPGVSTALRHGSPLDLLVATILSAQCTDERVNLVTKELFRVYRTADDYAGATRKELEKIIRSTGFYRAKAKNIIGCARMLVEKYGGKVPSTMDELVQLPGVGRKTANVLLGNYFGIAEGVVVDTHVKRLAGRLGFSEEENPEKIESDLMKIFQKRDWIAVGNLLIQHGRAVCVARKPRCADCPVREHCPSSEV